MSIKKEFISSVIANWVETGFRYLIALVLTPIIVHSLGNERYGIWSLAISFTGYYGIIDFGIKSTTVKFFSEYAAKSDVDQCNRLLSTVLYIYFFMATLACTFSLVLALFSDTLFKVSSHLEDELFIVILLIGINVGLAFLFKVFNGIIISLRRFDISRTIQVSFLIVRSVAIIVLLNMDYKLITMAVVVLSCDILSHITEVLFAFKLFPSLRIRYRLVSLSLIKSSAKFTANNFIIHTSRMITEKTDQVIIGIFLGVEYIVYYAIAESLMRYVRKVPKGITDTIMPFASHLDSKGEAQSLEAFLYIVPKYVLTFSIFALFIFYEFGKELIYLWMGPGFEKSYLLLNMLMLAEMAAILASVIGQVSVGVGKNEIYARICILETVSRIGLSILLLHYWGLAGVAMGVVITSGTVRGFLMPYIMSRNGQLSWGTWLKETIFPVVLSFALFILIYRLLSHYGQFSYNAISHLLGFLILGSFIYLVICFCIVFKEFSVGQIISDLKKKHKLKNA
jgi:O-antigen/teichoic acid export membrane protein